MILRMAESKSCTGCCCCCGGGCDSVGGGV